MALCVVVGVLVPAASAAAGTTTATSSYFNAVDCPSASVCVAVGSIETNHDNATGQLVGGSFQPIAVKTTDGGQTWTPLSLPTVDANLRAVSCSSTSACVAVGGTRTVYRGTWYSVGAVVIRIQGDSGSVVDGLPSGARALDAVNCYHLSDCVAVGGALETGTVRLRPQILVTRDGGLDWSSVASPLSSGQLETVACTSSPHCVALGADSYSNGFYSSSRPVALWSSTPTSQWHVSTIAAERGGPTAVACASAQRCLAVGDWFNWCWCGTGMPGRMGYAWATKNGGVTWSHTVLPVLHGYVIRYANAVSCGADACAVGATVTTVKSAQEYYAGFQRLSLSGNAIGAVTTSSSGLGHMYILGLGCAGVGRCIAAGQNWAQPAEATIEVESGGRWTTTYTFGGAPALGYAQGAAVARQINALSSRWDASLTLEKMKPTLLNEVRAGSLIPDFARGLLDNLTDVSVLDLMSLITYGTENGHPPLLDAFVTAYETARVVPSTSLAIAFAHHVDTNVFDQLFLGRLRGNESALADLLAPVSPDEIARWSDVDSGYPGVSPFEQAALTVVEGNWNGYANLAHYRGPFTKAQLAYLISAAATSNGGRASLTNSAGAWFLAHGGVPDVSGGASMASVASLAAWLSSLSNLNAAIAVPTAQYLYRTEALIHLAQVAAAEIGVWGVLSIVGDVIVGLITKPLVAAATGAITVARVWTAEETTFSTALRAGLTSYSFARRARDYDEMVRLIEDSYDLQGNINDLLNLPGQINPTVKNVRNYAAKVELTYLLHVVGNTLHEAVARLMQEHMIVTNGLQPFWQNSTAAVDQVVDHASGYLVVPPGASGNTVPPPPQVLAGQPSYRGVPVSLVEAIVVTQFIAAAS